MFDFIDGDYFESLADYSFGDMYSTNLSQPSYQILKGLFDKFDNPILFIETHRLGLLFRELQNFPNNRCRIIAHNSDATFGEDLLRHLPDNVDKLWCQNYNYIETDRLKSLPIGLERVRWFPEQKKQELLYNIMQEEVERTELVYMNFNPGTNPIRQQIYESLKDKEFINKEMIGNGGDYKNYLLNLKRHKFIISPPGNGIDCHRNWEAIYCGCIPIILESYYTKNIFPKLNTLVVDSYDKVTNNLLSRYYNSIELTPSTTQYWKKIIREE